MSSPQPQAIDPGPFLINSFGDRYLYSANRNVFNQEGSQALYRRKFKDLFTQKDQLHIILGSDGGLLIEYCRQQKLPKGSRYIFIELPEIIKTLKPALLNELPDSLLLFSPDDFWEQKKHFQLGDYIFSQRINVHTTFCVEDGFLCEYRDMHSHFENRLKTSVQKQLQSTTIAPFIEKAIANLCDNQHETTLLKNCFYGKTAVILGGGPSLDNIIPWLKKNRQHVVIFAVARICRQLFTEKITPHIIVTVDPQEIIFDFCKEMFFFEEKSLLVNAYHSSSCLINQWGGLKTYTGSRFPWPSVLNTENNVPIKGSTVTNLALDISFFMGCSQAILGGVDFCFSRKGFSHSSGSNQYQAGPNLVGVIPIETNIGEVADTRPTYYQAKQEMEEQAKIITAKGMRIINPSPDSAKMNHIEFIPLEKIKLKPELQEPLQIIRNILPQETSETRSRYYKQIKKELEDKNSNIVKVNSLLREALLCNTNISNPKKAQTHAKAKKRMDQIEEKLKNKFSLLHTFIRIYHLRGLLQATTVRTKEESWSSDEANKFMQKYYQTCLEGGKKIFAQLNNALTTVEMRLEEEKSTPDIKKLVHFWQENNQLGRARIWRKQHNSVWQKLSDKERQLVENTEKLFTALLQNSDTPFLQKQRQTTPLTGIAAIAVKYFKFKDEKALTRLAEGLKHHSNTVTAQKLLFFVNGLQYELKGNKDAALATYNTLISDQTDFLTEDVLRRVFSLCLDHGQYDDALLAAECLTGISITYAPFLARLHEIGDDKTKALDIYTQYMEQTGLDVSIMHKMAKIYLELGIIDGAELMYSTILEQDPQNITAQDFFKNQQKK